MAGATKKLTYGLLTGGSLLELVGAVVAVGFAVLGLAGYGPLATGAGAALALGGGLVASGLSIAARWRQALRPHPIDANDLATGVGFEIAGGVIGIALGAIVLANVAPAA